MKTLQLQEKLLEVINANNDKLNSAQKKYEYTVNQLTTDIVTDFHISQLTSLSVSLKSMLDDTAEAWGILIRLKNLDSDFENISELEKIVVGQEDYINKMVNLLDDLVRQLTIQKGNIEKVKNEIHSKKKSSSDDDYSGLIITALSLGATAFTALTTPSSTKRIKPKHTSGTKTGRKMGR